MGLLIKCSFNFLIQGFTKDIDSSINVCNSQGFPVTPNTVSMMMINDLS